MIEIERKFRLSPSQRASILQRLQDQHGTLESVHQSDQVFLQGMSSFKNFKRGMPVIRLRTINGHAQLTYKQGVNEKGDSIEHELEVGSAAIMQDILEAMGYQQVTLVVKERLEVKDDNLTIVLDAVDRLGDFIEIEIIQEEADTGTAEDAIMRKAVEFGLTEKEIEPKKYDQLLSALDS